MIKWINFIFVLFLAKLSFAQNTNQLYKLLIVPSLKANESIEQKVSEQRHYRDAIDLIGEALMRDFEIVNNLTDQALGIKEALNSVDSDLYMEVLIDCYACDNEKDRAQVRLKTLRSADHQLIAQQSQKSNCFRGDPDCSSLIKNAFKFFLEEYIQELRQELKKMPPQEQTISIAQKDTEPVLERTVSTAPSRVEIQLNNYALFFANDKYGSNADFKDLKNPKRDADTLAKELRDYFGFEVYHYHNYTASQVKNKLLEWQTFNFEEPAQLLIFFSGHGAYDPGPDVGYFVPYGRSNNFKDYIEYTLLGRYVDKIPCEHILMAVDACYSGLTDPEISLKGSNFGRIGQSESNLAQRIKKQLRNKTRLLITSGGTEPTSDGGEHSPFSWAIISSLRDTYTNEDGLLTFIDLQSELEKVQPTTPRVGNLLGHQNGGFVFVANDVFSRK